jgi:hypothetical protein
MTAAAIRRALVVVSVAGIAGMIATSIADSSGGALACGLVTGGAAVTLMALTAAARDGSVADEVSAGAEERRVRELVADAVRLGRSRMPTP